MTYPEALALAARYGRQRDFALSHREIKPWWAFWIREADTVWSALEDCDLIEEEE